MDNRQHDDRWNRRQFLGDMALTGAAMILGQGSALAAAEPPPESVRVFLHDPRTGTGLASSLG